MADPLNTEQAKAALADLARGRPPRTRDLTTAEAKRRLRVAAHELDLIRLTRTQPMLAVTMALGYGLMLGSTQPRRENFLAVIARILNLPMPARPESSQGSA